MSQPRCPTLSVGPLPIVGQLEATARKGTISSDVNRKYGRALRDEATWLRNAFAALEPHFNTFGYTISSLGETPLLQLSPQACTLMAIENGQHNACAELPLLLGARQLVASAKPEDGSTDVGALGSVAAGAEKRAFVEAHSASKRPRMEACGDMPLTLTTSPGVEVDTSLVHANGSQPASNVSPPRRPLIVTLGTRGDVQPFLPLCRAMEAAGWAPLLCSLPAFAPLASQAGVPFASLVAGDSAAPPPVNDDKEVRHGSTCKSTRIGLSWIRVSWRVRGSQQASIPCLVGTVRPYSLAPPRAP
eukprot:scaffold53008_cov32-Tisochrysis_lutea.AAC.2